MLEQTEYTWKNKEENPSLYFDSYFSSTDLCLLLSKNGFGVVSTMNMKRADIPKEVKDFSGLVNGNYRVFEINGSNVSYVQIKDAAKDLILITTIEDTNKVVECIRRSRKFTNRMSYEKDVTFVQDDYMYGMHGVDTMDRGGNKISTRRRTPKWTVAHFEHLIDVSLMNTFAIINSIYKKKKEKEVNDGKKPRKVYDLKRRKVTRDLGKQLCGISDEFIIDETDPKNTKRLQDQLELVKRKLELKQKRSKQCEICREFNIRFGTKEFCPKCNRMVCEYHMGKEGCMKFSNDEIKKVNEFAELDKKAKLKKETMTTDDNNGTDNNKCVRRSKEETKSSRGRTKTGRKEAKERSTLGVSSEE